MGCCNGSELQTRWFVEFKDQLPSLSGKRIAITGTTSGTGYIAAVTCARQGAEVILLNRESSRATASGAKLQEEVPSAVFFQIPCDLQDFASVRGVKDIFEKQFGAQASLDVLCCNAGIMAHPAHVTKNGFDTQMQTNHLSHFLLLKGFLPALKAAAKEKGEARVVSHSSGARHGGPLDAKYLQKAVEGGLGGNGAGQCFERYHQSKLANACFTYALEAKFAAAGLTSMKAVVCCPGIAETALVDGSPLKDGAMKCIWDCLTKGKRQTAEDGTMPLLTAIAAQDVQSGDLYTPSLGPGAETAGPVKVNRHLGLKADKVCVDPAALDLLWAESEKAIEESFEISA